MQVRARRLRTNGDGDISGFIRETRRACARLCPHFAVFEPFRGEPGIGWEAPRSHVHFISIDRNDSRLVCAGSFLAFDATASLLAPQVCFQKPP